MCQYCVQPFAIPWAKRHKRFCSTSCAARYGNDLRFADHVHVPSGKGHSGRAKRYGVEYETVRPIEIYRRDRWRCALCKKRVDKLLEWPHPMSASLDHVVPISRGGGHVAANVQLAHLRCNILKGASADAGAAADSERAEAKAR